MKKIKSFLKRYSSEVIIGLIIIIYFSGLIKNLGFYSILAFMLFLIYAIFKKIKIKEKFKNKNILPLKTNNDEYEKTSNLIFGTFAIIGGVIGLLNYIPEKNYFLVVLILGFLLIINGIVSTSNSFIEVEDNKLFIHNTNVKDTELSTESISDVKLHESELIFYKSQKQILRISFLTFNQNTVTQIKEFFKNNIKEIKLE